MERKRRPRPAPLNSQAVEVSRESGLAKGHGTFGKSARFDDRRVTGHGNSSPYGHTFYSRNQLYKVPALESEKSCTMGFGERPKMHFSGSPPAVGPGLYKIVHSSAGRRSPLDGDDYCNFTIKSKLPSALVGVPMSSPGPHAKYEVRTDLVIKSPEYKRELLSHNERRPEVPPNDEPGPGHYFDDSYKSVAISASCPNLSGAGERCMEATGGTKRCLKSTFGMADRFRAAKQTCSPKEDRYYAHSKIWDLEDYINGARSCSFGASGKTDFSNPFKGHRDQVSPVTYRPVYSTAYPTSPIDGLTRRTPSPVYTFAKAASTAKHARRRKMFGASPGGSPSSASMTAGGSGANGDA